MEAKFTKGKWEIKPIEDDKEYIRIRGTEAGLKFKIANVIDLKFHHDGSAWCDLDRNESMANAHLIAAAPEMYELLEELECSVLAIEQTTNNKLYQKLIRELLAKARGES